MAIIPSELTALLVADTTASGPVPTPTKVGVNNVSAAVEIQSTTRGFLLPRMTSSQRDAMQYVVNGMMIYNTTTNAVNTYENGAWSSSGGGDVDGPANSTNQGIATFNGVTGKLLAATSVLLNPATSIISGLLGLFNGAGTAAAPTYSFTGDTNTGLYQVSGDEVGIATAGVLQLSVSGANTSVNHLRINGSAAASPLTMTAIGTDADISISLVPKNTGQILGPVGSLGVPGFSFNGGVASAASGMSLNIGGNARTNYVALSANSTGRAALNANGVLSIGSTTFDATTTNALAIAAGTLPTGNPNVLQVYGATIAGNVGTLGLNIPAGSLTASADNAVTNKIQVQVNGTTYYLLATTSAA